ncbi:MAG: hypothetical protein OXG46_04275 [Chloroflexi bacterium]|nr:hypothetical protein [Chloroflexota bacterium]MCY3938623.1 hypothetical protein [Chloroflexota bacterium]
METWGPEPDRGNPLAFDYNHAIFDRIGAAAVEYSTASEHQAPQWRRTVQV